MKKSNLDRLLENAVAKAIGVAQPHKVVNRLITPARLADVKHAA